MMSLRSFVFQKITTDSVLNGLGFNEDNTFITHDSDTPRERPFLILRWGSTDPGLYDYDIDVASNLRRLTVWAHDDPGDYDRIDACLKRVCALLTNSYGAFTGTVGLFIGQIDWNGNSDDLSDDVVGTITRNSSFTIVGSAS